MWSRCAGQAASAQAELGSAGKAAYPAERFRAWLHQVDVGDCLKHAVVATIDDEPLSAKHGVRRFFVQLEEQQGPTRRPTSPGGVTAELELEDRCFYVGHSLDVETRIAAHFLGNGAGAKWTNLHRPLRVLSVVPGDTLLENLTTIALMVQHGHECVRGGKWCALEHKCPASIQRAMCFMRPKEQRDEKEADREAKPLPAHETHEECQSTTESVPPLRR